ncbi:MAG: hypothetical protein K0S44_873 [Bacteroidetes bacterium]|jgi:O-antigen/teichoic acid export membrane protein|nr:hypothetical protein [Bacteroidota bacterium]
MIKKIAFTFAIKIIIAVLNLAIVIVLSRYIGAAGKGEASLVATSLAMILLFCNIIGGSSLVYFVPRNNNCQLFFLSNCWSLLVCIASYFIFNTFDLIMPEVVLPLIVLTLINSFLTTNMTILLGQERITAHNIISLLQAIINLGILFLMFESINKLNVTSYIYSLYASMGLCLLISSFLVIPYLIKDKSPRDQKLVFKLFEYGAYSQAGHIMKFMSFRCTYYMLVNFSGEVVLGIFSNGVSLIESVFLISNSISTVLFPKVANSGDNEYSRTITIQLTRFSIILCLLALIPLCLLPPSFFTWLFGSEFAGVHNIILLLAPGVLFYNIALVIGHYFSGIGRIRVNTWANLTGLLTTVAMGMLFYPNFGIDQIAIISTVSYITTAALIIYHFKKDAGIGLLKLIPKISDIKWLGKEAKELFHR